MLQYGALNDTFPNQPTSDQFFDESQFESYRRLGLHTIDRICETRPAMDDPSVALASRINLRTFIDRARAYIAARLGSWVAGLAGSGSLRPPRPRSYPATSVNLCGRRQ